MTRAGPVTFQVLGLQMQCMLLTYYVGSEDPSSDLLVSSKPSPQPHTSCIAETASTSWVLGLYNNNSCALLFWVCAVLGVEPRVSRMLG